MFEGTYDIIDWKSCESSSSTTNQNEDTEPRAYPLSREDIASTTDINFPTLFHERSNSETSIVSMPEFRDYPLNFDTCDNESFHEEDTVYRKVANWVMMQRRFFRNVEVPVDDDDEIEVIDPVDLFHESVLDDYQIITEHESERRVLLRDFDSHRYNIESIEEAMQTHEYKFLRQPKCGVEMELTPLIEFHMLHKERGLKFAKPKKKRRKNSLESVSTIFGEQEEETINFLGVPRLLENYVILNREGYAVKPDNETDLWLSPLQEDLVIDEQNERHNFDLEFLSSWFSDVYRSDLATDEVRTLVTMNTDLMEKVTVISVGSEDEDVWVDAPDIPHWLDDEQQELELFNQPSRPLYYYRDRIKGCYRIIGVEDETVVLFSGNDDDTIFYPGEYLQPEQPVRKPSKGPRKYSPAEKTFRRRNSTDRKNDSGIEDVEDIVLEETDCPVMSFSNEEAKILGYNTQQIITKTVTFLQRPHEHFIVDWCFVLFAACIVILALCLVRKNEKEIFFQSKIINGIYQDFLKIVN